MSVFDDGEDMVESRGDFEVLEVVELLAASDDEAPVVPWSENIASAVACSSPIRRSRYRVEYSSAQRPSWYRSV